MPSFSMRDISAGLASAALLSPGINVGLTFSSVRLPSRSTYSVCSLPTWARSTSVCSSCGVGDGLSGELDDHVASLQADLGRRAVGSHLGHQHSFPRLQTELPGQVIGERLNHDAQTSAMHRAATGQLRGNPFRLVDGDGKSDPFVAAAAGRDGRIDPDHFAIQVHQGATAVARVNRGIRLNEVLSLGDAEPAAFGADDAGGPPSLPGRRGCPARAPSRPLRRCCCRRAWRA